MHCYASECVCVCVWHAHAFGQSLPRARAYRFLTDVGLRPPQTVPQCVRPAGVPRVRVPRWGEHPPQTWRFQWNGVNSASDCVDRRGGSLVFVDVHIIGKTITPADFRFAIVRVSCWT